MTSTFHAIELTATANNWRLFVLRKIDAAFSDFQEKIHARDNFTCQFCGFQAKKFMEIINLDGNYLKNNKSNLTTACGMCAQCFFLEAVGKSDFGGGVLIYLPEMSQAELNALCHVLFALQIYRLKDADDAASIYRSLKLRAQIVEEQIGEGMSNPSLFGQMLIDSEIKMASQFKNTVSKSIRLLPNLSRFGMEITQWADAGLNALDDQEKNQ